MGELPMYQPAELSEDYLRRPNIPHPTYLQANILNIYLRSFPPFHKICVGILKLFICIYQLLI